MRVISHLIENDEGAAKVAALLGGILLAWNQAENHARAFTGTFLGSDRVDRGRVLTAHMGSTTLFDALSTCANEFAETPLREHLLHFLAYAERVRAYRNYYAHGIAAVIWTQDEEPGGWAMMDSAKGRLAMIDEIITATTLREVLQKIEDLNEYASAITVAMGDEVAVKIYRYHHPEEPLPAWPDKPALPDRLKKPHRYLLEPDSQPQPSEA
jgi:hypothetical protein